MTIAFAILAFGAILTALVATWSQHPIYGALGLVAHILTLSGLFILLGAEVLAFLQILIYAGAVIVLFLFAIMYIGVQASTGGGREPLVKRLVGLGAGTALFLILFGAILRTGFGSEAAPAQTPVTAVALAQRLFSADYVIAFEATSVLLLAAIVGAIFLSEEHRREPNGGGKS